MAAKAKKMTAREKELRAKVRAELRNEGMLPPKKKPLNRKAFMDEAIARYEAISDPYARALCLDRALGCVMAYQEKTLEGVGAAKVAMAAAEIHDLCEEKKAQGLSEWTIGETFERIKPILEA